MTTEWRLLYDGINDARLHFAVEEALARLVDEGHTPPTLRMRQVRPAVFVGVYQNTWAEVDVEYCKANNIQIVRRANGGGAVYHEMGSFCFSAFFRRDLFIQSDEELYRLFASPAIQTCADYGVNAHFQGRNDLLVGGRKIYGSAQLSWYDAFVQSGTFLVNIDFEVMERALTPPALKFNGKSARSIQERVTSLSREVGYELETQEVMKHFVDNAADVLGIRLIPGCLTPEERELATELLAVKYGKDEWNFGSRQVYQVVIADQIKEGIISLSADIKDDSIQRVKINGDLLLSDRHWQDDLEQSLCGCSIEEAQSVIRGASLPAGIQEGMSRLLEKLTQEVTTISSKSKEKIT